MSAHILHILYMWIVAMSAAPLFVTKRKLRGAMCRRPTKPGDRT